MEMVKKDIENRADVESLVNSFYQKVERDDLIAHFFTRVVAVDWKKHLPIMYDFWESILLDQHNYHGSPMPKHISLYEKSPMTKAHFDRWLQLFSNNVDELFAGPKAELAKTRALSISTVMRIKVIG